MNRLTSFVRDSTPEQIRAWRSSIPPLQQQCGVLVDEQPAAQRYCAILEYRMPDGSTRVDAVLLLCGAVLIVEMKGDGNWQPEYREQAADCARRLFWFHRYCGEDSVRVHTVLVNYGFGESTEERDFLTTTRIERLAEIMKRFDRPETSQPLPLEKSLSTDACQPTPSLVEAVRQYFSQHALPRIKRIDEVTQTTVQRVIAEIRHTHARRSRKLLLVSGVPGAGKTYVGLQTVHDRFLDDLAEPMQSGEKPTAPAVFLSGNGPLVEVLQYELKSAGGDGRVFVRGVKDFVAKYSKKRSGPPPHHVLIFDEAQRAWDARKVQVKHKDVEAVSEPHAFISFAERVPGWCVVMGLIGSGQEPEMIEKAVQSPAYAPVLATTSNFCFVMMPFGAGFDAVYRQLISPAAEECGLTVARADEMAAPGFIMEQIRAAIQQSRICVVDVSDRNPNVLFELGLAQASNKPTILLARDVEGVPFDIASQRLIVYGRDFDAARDLLITAIKNVLSSDRLSEADRLLGLGMYRAAIAMAAIVLEHALRAMLANSGIRSVRPMGLGKMLHQLNDTQPLDADLLPALRDAVGIRNRAIHDPTEPSAEDARFVVDTVRELIRRHPSIIDAEVASPATS